MRIGKLIILTLLVASLVFFSPRKILASEGAVELKSTINKEARCFALSVLMRDLNYNILLDCRDLTYPPTPSYLIYVAWATPIPSTVSQATNQPILLGEVNLGKAIFKSKIPFSNIYVTREQSLKIKTPSKDIVMVGTIRPLTFLESPRATIATGYIGELEPEQTPTPTPKPTFGGKVQNTWRYVIVTFPLLFMFGIIFFLLYITRKK